MTAGRGSDQGRRDLSVLLLRLNRFVMRSGAAVIATYTGVDRRVLPADRYG